MARPVSNAGNPSKTAAMSDPTSTVANAYNRISRRARPSPSWPMIGEATAPASSVAVSIHCPVLIETWSACAIVGMSGAPRLLTKAMTSPMRTRTGTIARSRHSTSAGAGAAMAVSPGWLTHIV
jgi:hypothetical protein